jgi:hypothetical protein
MSDVPKRHRAEPRKVGYRQPPERSRFQRGKPSANPRGRPKRQESFADLIRKELKNRIWVQENGKRIRITKREAWMRRIVNGAIKRKPRDQRTFVKIAKPAEAWLGEASRHIFWLIDSEYKDKKPKS